MNLPALPSSKISEKYESSEIFSLIFPIFGIIASILIVALVIWPKINEIKDLQKTNEQLVIRADNLENKIEVLALLDEEVLEDQIIAAERLLPSEKSTFPFLSQVEGASVTSGIVLNKVEVLDLGGGAKTRGAVAKNSGAGTSESIRLSITSDYQSLLQFLTNINLFSRISTVDEIKIDVSIADGTQLSSAFTVRGYWKELPSSLGSIESPVVSLTSAEESILKEVTQPESSEAPELPDVPVGRGNLFTPF